MGEVIQFIPKSERERIRMIREARAIYESIFPSEPSGAQETDASHTSGASGALHS